MRRVATAALLCLASLPALGQTFSPLGPAVKVLSERGYSLAVHEQAKVTLGDDAAEPGEHVVAATGAGLRVKKIVVNVSVYSMSSYLDEAAVTASDPMGSVTASKVKVLQARFLRNLTQAEIRDAFTESLAANHINPQTSGLAKLLNSLPGRVAAGSLVTFYGYALASGHEAVAIDFAGTRIRSSGKDLAQQFWTMWFGKPSDAGLATLKSKLIGGL